MRSYTCPQKYLVSMDKLCYMYNTNNTTSFISQSLLELGGTQILEMVWYFIQHHGINNYYDI